MGYKVPVNQYLAKRLIIINPIQLLQGSRPHRVQPLLPGRRPRQGRHLRAAEGAGEGGAEDHARLQDEVQALRAAQRAPLALLAGARPREPRVQRQHDQGRDRGLCYCYCRRNQM